VNYQQACIKRDIEFFLLFPLVLLGKGLGYLFKLKQKSSYFLFFPSADIGGSPKVNADILYLLKDKKPIVIFSKKANNNGFKELFYSSNCTIIHLHKLIDNKYIHFMNVIYRGIISTWINQSENPIVFGGECMYFYKVIPHLTPSVKRIELSHLNTWLNYNQAFVEYIDLRIASTPKLKRYFEQQYLTNKIPSTYLSRLLYIDNWVDIPPYSQKTTDNLNVLFVGRGAPQKRVHIISAIAEEILKKNNDISFTFVGDVQHILSEFVMNNSVFYEFVKEKEELASIYDQADILILTSAFEGLPIVIMDMMARGKVVISTAVDGIPDYIIHNKSGLLIDEIDDENKVKEKGIELILKMNSNRELLHEIGMQARKTAQEKFNRELFEEKYKAIFSI
jgi:glycosyltransferase involved in cell wall biosynthesis